MMENAYKAAYSYKGAITRDELIREMRPGDPIPSGCGVDYVVTYSADFRSGSEVHARSHGGVVAYHNGQWEVRQKRG